MCRSTRRRFRNLHRTDSLPRARRRGRQVTADSISPPVAELLNVTKWYGPVIGVNAVSFQLAPGITGLVGPNGAGKTTLMKLLTGQLHPSLGEVLVRGQPAWSAAAKRHI